MLFHVTMTHTMDNCPGYNQERFPELLAGFDRLDAAARELNVKIHFFVDGLPEHVAYALLEADNPSSVAFFVSQIPIRQDFKLTAVEHVGDIVEKARTMMPHG